MADKRHRKDAGPADFRTSSSLSNRDWQDHKHVTPPMKAQAERLLPEAGTPELAKHAVDSLAEPQPAAADKDEFARRLGFASYLDLFEASTRATSDGGRNWFITALRGGSWIAWNDADLIASDTFPSAAEARRQIPAAAAPHT